MIRTPLRPLARVLRARERGEDPSRIEAENLRLRNEANADRARARAEGRLLLLGLAFTVAFGAVGVRMGALAATVPDEQRVAAEGRAINGQRADILDRNGRVLATNFATHALYAQPRQMIEPDRAARELAAIFPDLDEERLKKDFNGSRSFVWVRKRISPEQMQMVHDIGSPGLLFGPREMRLFPNGPVAAHILGGARFDNEGVSSADVVGTAGVERLFDARLRDPAQASAPLKLSLDLTVQAATEEVLAGGMALMNAKGAASVLMDVHTGEVLALASLPDFDPNTRPTPLTKGDRSDDPLFNRAVQGLYELGSTFKIFTVAQAMELGQVNPTTLIDTKGPLMFGRQRIRDFHRMDPQMTVEDVIAESSNVGTARIALNIGANRQREFLAGLGLTDPTGIELTEAASGKPLLPPRWGEVTTATVSYGHGISVSPLHLAQAYATIANGGRLVTPTLLAGGSVPGVQVMRPEVARRSVAMLRRVVTEGTASMGDVAGYEVAGKTGTADKPKPTGGYYSDRTITTFASVFPASDPKYVLIVTLDEPVQTIGDEPKRTAGWTAVPVAAEMIRRIAPLLGLRPAIEPVDTAGVTLTANR